jgi:WD40 repeat protein
MSDVFISYSRKDAEFVRRLHEILAAQNREVWVDWEDIPPTADWRAEIRSGIEAAGSVIFVISPDFVRSKECRVELELALENNKRLVPVMYRMITDPQDQPLVHEALNSHNWVYLREEDDFNVGYKTLESALDTDLDYVREHTRLLVRAREWVQRNKLTGFLLTRTEIKEAQKWLKEATGKQPHPTNLHLEYISASQQFLNRQRAFQIALVTALFVALAFLVLSVVGFQEAERNRVLAENNAATSVVNERLAVQNAVTATIAQGEAQIQAGIALDNAATADSARSTSEFNAIYAAAQAGTADAARATSVVSEHLAIQNAATATIAQGEALIQANIALDNAATATIAQGEALIQANIAATQAAEAENARATSVVNEGLAVNNAATATIAQGEALVQANIAATQAVNAQNSAATATVALGNLQEVTRYSTSLGLAAQAQLALNGNVPDLSILLSLEALNYAATGQAEQALGLSVLNSRLRGSLLGHTAPVALAVYSPDDSKIVTASVDTTAKVWDAKTRNLLFTLSGHEGAVNGAAWSPDGFYIVTASDDQTAKIWDATTGELVRTLQGHTNYVLSAAWSPDGTRIATASYDETAKVWDAQNGEVLTTIQADQSALHTVMWSPDSTRVLTLGFDNTAVLWSARNGSFNSRFRWHSGIIYAADWSPDGTQLVTASEDKTAIIWDVASTRVIHVFTDHLAPVYSVDWSADGTKIATASGDGTVKIWDSELRTNPLTLSVSVVYTLNLSRDATHLITTGFDPTAKIWEIKSAGERFTILPTEPITSNVQWSPDGRYFVGGIQQGTTVWDGSSGTRRYGPFLSRGGDVLRVVWSPDGSQVLVAKYTGLVEVWSVNSSEEPIFAVQYTSETGSITGVTWSPDGESFAVSGLYNDTAIYQKGTDQAILRYTIPETSALVVWSPNGEEILTGNADLINIWDAETGELLTQANYYGAVSAAWSPDGMHILVGFNDGTAGVFDTENFGGSFVSGHIGEVSSVDWSPNGMRFITASSDGTAKVWDAQTGVELLTLSDNTSALISADWSPDGNRVVTADLNGVIKVWNVWQTLDDLVTFAQGCCVVRELTPQERIDAGLE